VLLWVRSYRWSDGYEGSLYGWFVEGVSEQGQLWTAIYDSGHVPEWRIDTLPVTLQKPRPGFGIQRGTFVVVVFVPHWSLTVAFATLAALPWIPCRFSLRTLLIAMSLMAILLGLIVYTVRS
jgi:hypothetical protein